MTPWITVDLAAVRANYHLLQKLAGSATVGAAVKANAYGLGLLPVAKALQEAGCSLFFTAYLGEALALRKHDQTSTIVALHGFDAKDFDQAVESNIVPMINHLGALKAWSSHAAACGRKLPAMVHLDTGMNRLGLDAQEQETLANNHDMIGSLDIMAWVSHLACADTPRNGMNGQQKDMFLSITSRLPTAPRSLSSSSGMFLGHDFVMDITRPGIALYGGNPTPEQQNPMENVVSLHAKILQIRATPAGATIGYGATRRIDVPAKIATLSLGYADGYNRALSDKGAVQIGSFLAPVLGRISMDLVTVDVSEIPESEVYVGAKATLIGPHRPIDQAACEAGTISYELLTRLGERISRTYN